MNAAPRNPYEIATAHRVRPDPREDTLIEKLNTAECWRLLERARLGRLALKGLDGAPDVFPMNFLVHSGCIYLRSAPGSKLLDIVEHPEAAFEVDGESAAQRWSVVVRGSVQRLDADDEIHESGVLDLVSWSPTGKHDFIRLAPTAVTGRRFHKPASVRASRGADSQDDPQDGGRVEGGPVEGSADAAAAPRTRDGGHKPVAIPHFAPPPPE
ncbi:pyridoxamine 5'-phosphate oxidase family protein [Microbacterium ulmi]|uniref:Pyridoxamine 5'-phosphate oxidase family protein n=1 Tax=Microbacterium ulmi TaxID=179095 RepID=A0A7Y2Q1L7_9MICO|nr:pyridoxamine 5'-phosphate oxidase family protein [Microbacterium ulmi]NII69327.1 hypothetical protein [Microbacterium ulmi]NNH04060.1 pyridoxamine 5'-phosphate oxidase family protein [Microbacterium ulmi]